MQATLYTKQSGDWSQALLKNAQAMLERYKEKKAIQRIHLELNDRDQIAPKALVVFGQHSNPMI